MTVSTRYNLYKKGKITKEQFLYEARKDQSVPFITPLTSFNEAVSMLKQRRIIVETFTPRSTPQTNEDPYMQGFMAAEKGEDYQDCPFMRDDNPEEYEAWCDGWSDASAKSESAGEEEIPAGLSAADEKMIGDYEEDMANSEMGKHQSSLYRESAPSLREQVKDFVKKAMEGGSSMDEAKEQAREYFSTEEAALGEGKDSEHYKKSERDLNASLSKFLKNVHKDTPQDKIPDKHKAAMKALNEAVAKQKLGVDQVNPYELKKGIECEMGYSDKPAPAWGEVDAKTIEAEYKKAQAKALKNLNKDPMYYTRLKANGGKKEKKVTEKKVQADGYIKAKAPKVVNEGIKTSVSKIREYVVAQLKGEGITAKTNDPNHNQEVQDQINKVPNPSAKKELSAAFKAGKTIDI